MNYSPLEQFEILLLYPLSFLNLFDISITNSFLYIILAISTAFLVFNLALYRTTLVPNKIQLTLPWYRDRPKRGGVGPKQITASAAAPADDTPPNSPVPSPNPASRPSSGGGPEKSDSTIIAVAAIILIGCVVLVSYKLYHKYIKKDNKKKSDEDSDSDSSSSDSSN